MKARARLRHRVYLAVTFNERQEAKRAGALWDADRKAWYTQHASPALQRWVPTTELSATTDARNTDFRRDFSAELTRLGCIVQGPHPIVDGRGHRIATEGDRGRKTSGFYVLHGDGTPAGYAINHRTGETLHWHSRKTPQLTPEQEAHMRAKTTQQAHDRTMARQLRQAAVSAQVQQRLRKLRLTLPGERTSYLQNKGVDAQPGIFTDPQGRWTHIPMHDLNGRVWSSQIIDPSGSKRFTSGGRTEGCLHVLGGMRNLQQAQRQGGVAVLAEGYATAATVSNILHQTQTPTAAIATFNAGNLPPVATALRNRYPNLPILIAGDDDRNNTKNVGRRKALQAAAAVGGQTVFPPFTSQHPQGLTDWNDLDQHYQNDRQREPHRKVLREAVERCRVQQASLEHDASRALDRE